MDMEYLIVVKAVDACGEVLECTSKIDVGTKYPPHYYISWIEEVAKAIKNYANQDMNWPIHDLQRYVFTSNTIYAGILPDDNITEFNKFVPCSSHGIDAVTDITIYTVFKEQQLL